MNSKITIPIVIGVIIIIVGIVAIVSISINSDEIQENIVEVNESSEVNIEEEMFNEIQEKLDQIEKERTGNEYTPKEREWLTSGPFQIDRSEYLLGEKIFLRASISPNDKGQVAFLRTLNDTHYSVYLTIPFDGMMKNSFGYYLEPKLSGLRKLCSVEDIIGDWKIVFSGTDYSNLEFSIKNQTLPGDEEKYSGKIC